MPEASTDHRRATAERNVEAILDAAESLLERGAVASTTAVAAEAGVSRVTVYSHFPTRDALLEGVVERSVSRFTEALAEVDPLEGDPMKTLHDLIARAWSRMNQHAAIARVVVGELSAVTLVRAHNSFDEPILDLIRRGQAQGAFRDDLTPAWLLSSYYALMHAGGDDVRAGKLDPDDAVPILQATLGSLFAPGAGDRAAG